MTKRTKKVEAERAAWRARRPWPVAILGVDPGGIAGAALVTPGDTDPVLQWVRTVDPLTRDLEACVADAGRAARAANLRLVCVLEDWGAGGMRGIDQWLGLGASRGHWRRAVHLYAKGEGADVCTVSKLFAYAKCNVWRSLMELSTGVRDANGKHVPNDVDGWKRAATRRLVELLPNVRLDTADAAEAGLIALYASRSDAVGKLLSARLLREHGFPAA